MGSNNKVSPHQRKVGCMKKTAVVVVVVVVVVVNSPTGAACRNF